MTWDGHDRRSPEHLETLLESAAERGAIRALERVGLHDANAGKDINDLRNLIDGWRGVKSSVGKSVAHGVTMAILGLLALGLWFWTHK